MEDPLFSTAWYRVAELRPHLTQQLKVIRHPVRDQLWYVLVEPASGRQLRLNPAAYQFAGRCDGRLSVAQLWSLLLELQGDDAPSQDEILRLLAQLFRAGMVQFDAAPHLSLLFARRAEEGQRRRRTTINPLMLRLRLLDPSRMLDWLEPRLRILLTPATLVVWLVAVVFALLAGLVNWGPLKAEAVRHLASPAAFFLAWLCYPVVKAVHELGHALAVRRMGGEVHEMGISLMFLTPAPYVDASAANSFPGRHQRALVSAAGIMVELGLAALAMGVWLATQPGLLRDLAFVVLILCSISTVLFNANPLLRLDGYHVMCDLLDLPNLAQRSQAWWSTLWRRLVRGSGASPQTALAKGEAKWLAFYAPASLLCRVVLLAGLVTWIGSRSWLLGWIAALAFLAWLGWLVKRAATGSFDGLIEPRARARVIGSMLSVGAALAFLVFVVPAPSHVVARGVLWPPEQALVRPQVAGFISKVAVTDGSHVEPGDVLITLSDPALEAERQKRASQLAGLQAQQYQALLGDPTRATDIEQDIQRNQAELLRSDEQLAQLQIRSATAGRVVLPHEADMAGTFTGRGAMLGYIVGEVPANVRVVMTEQDVALVRNSIRSVEVRLADEPLQPYEARLIGETPAATHALPAAVLGDRSGGAIAVDPADKEGLRTLAPVFLLDLALPGRPAAQIGARAWVRFDLGFEPLGWQWGRRLRQLLLKQFNPSGQV